MSKEKSGSVLNWLLPLIIGASITLLSNQLLAKFEENERHRDMEVEKLEYLFHDVATMTGELYFVTRNLVGELNKPASTQVQSLGHEYSRMMERLNTRYLIDRSVLEYRLGKEFAIRFEDKIVSPLISFNGDIEKAVINQTAIATFESKMDSLATIENEIIEFNKDFIRRLDEARKGK